MVSVLSFPTYFFVLLLSFFGLYVGVLLGFLAREERKIKKYYHLLKFFIILIILFYLFISYIDDWLLLAIFLFFAGITILVAKIPDPLLYASLGIVYFLATSSTMLFFAQSLLIFLLGLSLGTLFVADAETKYSSYRQAFLALHWSYGWYLLVAAACYVIALFLF
ncbi:MAG: hypothetical protein QW594_03700 [Candidatus Woesearchaeota archaeon]